LLLLTIAVNQISVDGGVAFAKTLKENFALTSLQLSGMLCYVISDHA